MLRCACSAEPTEATPGHFGCLRYAPTHKRREIVDFDIQLSNYLDDVTRRIQTTVATEVVHAV